MPSMSMYDKMRAQQQSGQSSGSAADAIRVFVELQLSCDPLFPSTWDPHDPRLSWKSPYGLSSFTYATLGLLQLTVFQGNFDEFEPRVGLPLRLQATCMFLQSIATFLADVQNLSHSNIWHLIDRWLAAANTILLLSNAIWLPIEDQVVYVVAVGAGLTLLSNGRSARVSGDMGLFTWWHTAWHCMFPSLQALWLWSRASSPTLRLIIMGTILVGCAAMVLDFVVLGCAPARKPGAARVWHNKQVRVLARLLAAALPVLVAYVWAMSV